MKSGETGKIDFVLYYGNNLFFRMNALGIRVGNEIKVLRNLWFFPIHIRISTTEMFIRRKDAQNIWID